MKNINGTSRRMTLQNCYSEGYINCNDIFDRSKMIGSQPVLGISMLELTHFDMVYVHV